MKFREVRPFFVAGDIFSFLLIGLVGMSNHDSGFTLGVIARTTLPFLLPWLVIAYALGLPLDLVLYSSTKRPFTVADKGQPISALFA